MDHKEEILFSIDLKEMHSKSMGPGVKTIKPNGASEYTHDFDNLIKEQVQIKQGKKFDWSRLKKIYSSAVDNEEYFLKRPFDIALSLLGIIFSFPLWVIIAAAIKLEDRGDAFFISDRIGKDGKTFKNFKFRTMIPDSDKHFGPLQAKENDQRVTRVGKLLRKTAMDELPQLWNILKGDMTFVGPRALLPAEIEVRQESSQEAVPIEKIRGFSKRHSVTPGLTGIAQIFAPRDIIRKRKFQYDLFYIKRQSLIVDIELILLSFWITFRGKWESRGKKF